MSIDQFYELARAVLAVMCFSFMSGAIAITLLSLRSDINETAGR